MFHLILWFRGNCYENDVTEGPYQMWAQRHFLPVRCARSREILMKQFDEVAVVSTLIQAQLHFSRR